MGLDLGPHGERHIVHDRVIVQFLADDDRFAFLASRRRGQRAGDDLPKPIGQRTARFRIGQFRRGFVCPVGFAARATSRAIRSTRFWIVARLAARVAGEVPLTSASRCHIALRRVKTACFSASTRARLRRSLRGQLREGLLLQPPRIGGIFEPAVVDADVVSLDILGQHAAVAAVNASVKAGNRFHALGRRRERGDIIVSEARNRSWARRGHDDERHGDQDEQPDEAERRVLIDFPFEVRVRDLSRTSPRRD